LDGAAAAASDDGDTQGITTGSHGDGCEVGEWREKLEVDLFRGSNVQAKLQGVVTEKIGVGTGDGR
jgi:hypothetical protein